MLEDVVERRNFVRVKRRDARRRVGIAAAGRVETGENLDGKYLAVARDAAGRLAAVEAGIEPGGDTGDMRPVLAEISVPLMQLAVVEFGGAGAGLRVQAVRAERYAAAITRALEKQASATTLPLKNSWFACTPVSSTATAQPAPVAPLCRRSAGQSAAGSAAASLVSGDRS